MERVLIFIPTYNERENVELLYARIRAVPLPLDILFADDASPDGTGKILDALAAKDSKVSILHRPGKLGIGSAHRAGIEWAYDHDYPILVTMDADFTHDPALIPDLLKLSDQSDLVIPSRYLQDHSLSDWNLFRKFMTRFGHLMTYHLLGIRQDATGGYRIYRLDKISRTFLDKVTSNGYAFFFESLYVLVRMGMKVAEAPISLPKRTYGSSKMSLREVFRSIRQLLVLYVRRLRESA